MKKKGFTLVELLGVIVVLIIVLGMAVVGYIKIQEGIKKTYYHSQEESIMLAATEFYNYNEAKIPQMFGEAEKVSLQELISNGYMENVLDRNKKDCDLDKSSVIAYRDSYEKIQYEVCLVCLNDNYKTENDCEIKTIDDYGLKVTATIGETKREYKEGTWVNQDVWLTFTTGNDVNSVTVKGTTTGTKSCNLTKTNGLKTCKIKVDASDTYTIIGNGNNSKTIEAQTKTIKIDKVKPTYTVEDPTGAITRVSHTNDEYVIDFGSDTVASVDVTTKIKDIIDTLSGIEGIRYSIEKQGSSDKYTTLSINNTEATFTRTLTNGTWILKVEVRDIAGNLTTKTIKYHMYQKVTRPTNSYCVERTYNDTEQTFTKTAPTGVNFANTKGTNAGNYTVTASLKEYYSWSTGERRNNQTFVCTIKQRDTTCTSDGNSKEYDGTALTKTSGGSCTNLVSGHAATFTNSGTITNAGSTANTISNIVIKRGNTVVTSNYNITRKTGTLTVTKRNTTCTSDGNSKEYDGTAFTKTSGGSCTRLVSGHAATFTNTGTITNVGSTANTISNIVIKNGNSDVTGNYNITRKTGTLTVTKRNTTCTSGSSSRDYNGSALTNSTGSCTSLVSGHTATFTNTGTITNVGSVANTVSGVVIKTGNTDVTGNYNITTKTGTLTITRASVGNPPGTPTSKTYSGGNQGSGITCPTGTTTTGTSSATDANTYKQTCTPDGNHKWADGTTGAKEISWTISKRNTTCTSNSDSKTYNGTALTKTGGSCTNLISGHAATFTNTGTITNVGSVANTVSSVVIKTGNTDVTKNYNVTTSAGTLTITRASLGNPPGSPADKTYNGGNQGSGISCPSGSSAGGTTSATNANTYKQTCTPDGNHKWADGTTGAKEISWKINKANATCTITSVPTLQYPGSTTGTIGYSCTGDGAISVASNNASVITTSGSTLTANGIGTATITVSRSAGTNYNVASASSNVTVSASTYTVNYDNQSGSGCSSKTVTYGSTYGSMCTPSRTGFTFIGWYNSPTSGFDSNYYANTYGDLRNAFGYDYNALLNHWITYGMAEGRASSTTYINSGMTYSTNGNQTLYAHWKAKVYTIYFDDNLGSGGPGSISYEYSPIWEDFTQLSSQIPTRPGFQFMWWMDLNGNTFSPGIDWSRSTVLPDNYTLYAQWYPIYTIYYNDNYGTGGPGSQSYVYSPIYEDFTYISGTTPTRPGYKFMYWETTGLTIGPGMAWSRSNVLSDNYTLYAHWEPSTVSVSISIDKVCPSGLSGYQKDATATITCTSDSAITGLAVTVDGVLGGNLIIDEVNRKVGTIALSQVGDRTISATCINAAGGSASDTKVVSIHKYSSSSACGSGKTSTSYSGYCQCYFTGGSTSTACSKYSLGSSSACSNKCKSVYGSNYLRSSSSCSSTTTTTYPECCH